MKGVKKVEVYDVVVIGAGPAGLAAGLEAKKAGAEVLIIERERRPGGILKQCIHDGFGLIKFREKLSGPEYAERYIKMAAENNIPIMTSTFVTDVKKIDDNFELTLINSSNGVSEIIAKTLILANGCRERTLKQAGIHGTRPSGVYTAGLAQHLINISGYLPCRRCVILGSGDIGLIMARRLKLEGSEVVGVYEIKNTPSGLSRNIAQCLEDYNIPLHLSKTVTRVVGEDRVCGVEISDVDENMKPRPGTEEYVECDGLILSVGLIPENEIAESLEIEIDKNTKGPVVDQNLMTMMEGVFSCGNALHVNDLVDYVSESGEIAGNNAALYALGKPPRKNIPIRYENKDFLYVVPQRLDIISENKNTVLFFRSREIKNKASIKVKSGDRVIFSGSFSVLRPPEMERIEVGLGDINEEVEGIDIVME